MSKLRPEKKKSNRSGCFLIVAAVVFVVASGIYFLSAGIRDAKRVEQTLIDQFGWATIFTPEIDGSISPERIEKFIRVRQAVQAACVDYQAVLDSVIKLEQMEANKEGTASEVASTGMEGFKSVFNAGPTMLNFSQTRNQALLDAEMGIGEYMYIYLAAYGEQLASESTSTYSGTEEAYPSSRTRKEYIQILHNQLKALETSDQRPAYAGLADRLRQEQSALETGSQLSPWSNGPVGVTKESLAPFQQELNDLYCPGVVKIELLQKNRGFQLGG
jgi:hypothetical protein